MSGVGQDAVSKQTVAQQRAEFAATFDNVSMASDEHLPSAVNPFASSLGRRRGAMSETDQEYHNKLMSIERRLALTGVKFYTVLNMNPFPLKVNGVVLSDMEVPACPSGRPYSIYVIDKVRFSRRAVPDEHDEPVEIHPVDLARQFFEHFYGDGGVIVYEGDGRKEDPTVTMSKNPALARNLEEAKARMISAFRSRVNEATGRWNSPNSIEKKAITDIDRTSAMMLHDMTGEELPPWVQKTPGQFGLGEKCPRCKAIPASDAYMCPNCTYVLNPKAAYEAGDIDVDDISMKRLSRETLKEMGISELIEETIEERQKNRKREATEKRAEMKKAGK